MTHVRHVHIHPGGQGVVGIVNPPREEGTVRIEGNINSTSDGNVGEAGSANAIGSDSIR
jgi:hypothetical protein